MIRRHEFGVVLRGYDRDQVDALIRRAGDASGSSDAALRAAVRDELRAARIDVRLRGYDRSQVDGVLRGFADQLAQPAGA